MWERIQIEIRKNLRQLARVVEIIVVIMWLVSQFVPALDDWMREQRIIELVILALIVEMISGLTEIKDGLSHPLLLHPDQGPASQISIEKVSKTKPSIAKIMGLSAGKREDILNILTSRGWEIKLLIQHPDAAMNEILKHHLAEKIQELANVTFINYEKVEIRLYRRPCYIRGTKLGKVSIALGWYACGEGIYELFGHSNPVLSASEATPEAFYLESFFDRAFDYLWNHKETITLKNYFESLTAIQ